MRITAQSMGYNNYLTYKMSNNSSSMSGTVNSMLSSLASSTTSASGDMSSLAAQYSSLKVNRGVLKNYYSKLDSSSVSDKLNNSASASDSSASSQAALKTLASEAGGLAKDAVSLASTGRDSLFKADKDGNYDMEAIASAVSDFVSSYNATKTAVVNSADSKSVQTAVSMVNGTSAVEKTLNKVGITINKDNSLSINTDTFKSSEMSDIKALFSGTDSYAYGVAKQATQIQSYAASGTGNLFSGYSGTKGSIIDVLA